MTSSPGDENGSFTSSTVMIKMSALIQAQAHKGASANMSPVGVENTRSLNLHKSKSSPSTPSHHFQASSSQQISPSTAQPTREGSPRSLHSESSHTPSAPRRPFRACKFEAGMAKARRRVPYSCGPEKLDVEPEQAQRALAPQEETKLTADMQELYLQLVPNPESEDRRARFVQKLESILQARWPGRHIQVSVFGSTGNCLGTSDSDVDICITTDCKELEHVCSIAELLDQNRMERVVCVSSAKVPIVKAWDPELQVACDINVNNPIALENTQMIRSYTAIDDRFRPLAMIVKYWAKKRILNDAALGGTLSSYTWICMVLNFLQTRDPPILPSLQAKPGLAPKDLNGVNVAYDKALGDYKEFGAKNKSSLGQLLFQFFRLYGHELDFEANVLSVRLGKMIPKSQKAWHLLQDNRLCVEEPFNISRNLANTADDTSMRGIHLELRRAFKLIAEGGLSTCCEQYEAVPEERKHTETFIHPTARPIIPQVPTQPAAQTHRSSRNNFRGRHNNRNVGRRASNPAGRNSTYLHDLPFQMTPQELQLQAQHQQHLLHDQLFQQYQYLQLQEQELRMQLYQQSLRQRGMTPAPTVSQNGLSNGTSTETSSLHLGSTPIRLAMSPGLLPNRYSATSPFLRHSTPASGVMTNPASPSLSNAVPETRRYTRRTSMTNSSPAGSLRAQSQPARTLPFGGGFNQIRPTADVPTDHPELPANRRILFPYHPHMFASSGYLSQPVSATGSLYEAGRRPAEYMGYYVGQSPSLPANTQSNTISPIPSHAGLAIHNGGLSPRLSSRSSKLSSVTSSPSLHNANLEEISELAASSDFTNTYHTASEQPQSPKGRSGPLIVDGSVYSPQRRRPVVRTSLGRSDGGTLSASTSDDPGIDTPSSSDDQYQEYRKTSLAQRRNQTHANQMVKGVSEQLRTMSINSVTPLTTVNGDENIVGIDETNDMRDVLNDRVSGPITGGNELATSTTNEAKPNGTGNRKKKTRPEKVLSPTMESSAGASTPLATRTNGQEAGSISPLALKHPEVPSGWQTQKKKKRPRKVVRSENDATLTNGAGGEMPPAEESLRKGG